MDIQPYGLVSWFGEVIPDGYEIVPAKEKYLPRHVQPSNGDVIKGAWLKKIDAPYNPLLNLDEFLNKDSIYSAFPDNYPLEWWFGAIEDIPNDWVIDEKLTQALSNRFESPPVDNSLSDTKPPYYTFVIIRKLPD